MSVYLDHNATTRLRPEARARWLEVQDGAAGNPSSLHAGGRHARAVIDEARERIAAALRVEEDAIVFTSGGTEANNLALFGVTSGVGRPPSAAGVVTTAVEHSAVLEPARELQRRGHPLTVVGVDARGLPDADAVLDAVDDECAIVSVHAANNELGSCPDLARIGPALRTRRARGSAPWFHTDAVQALGRIPLDLDAWGVDLASFSAHKVGGPVGVGVLVRRQGAPLRPLLYGGGQEAGLRPGTEDAAGIAAAAVAIDLAVREQAETARHTHALCALLWNELRRLRPDVRSLGPPLDDAARLPNTLCVTIPGVDGRVLVTRLDLAGLRVSAGSACASGSLQASHVLRAIGLDDSRARSGLRLSVGGNTTAEECKRAAEILCATTGPSHTSQGNA